MFIIVTTDNDGKWHLTRIESIGWLMASIGWLVSILF